MGIWKTGADKSWRSSQYIFGKSWIWDQYLSKIMNGNLVRRGQYLQENIKWKLGNMGSRSILKREMKIYFWIWDQYLQENMNLEFGKFQLKEHQHLNLLFIFNWRNLNIWIWFFQLKESPHPSTSDSHPFTSPPLWGHEWSWGLDSKACLHSKAAVACGSRIWSSHMNCLRMLKKKILADFALFSGVRLLDFHVLGHYQFSDFPKLISRTHMCGRTKDNPKGAVWWSWTKPGSPGSLRKFPAMMNIQVLRCPQKSNHVPLCPRRLRIICRALCRCWNRRQP